MIKKTIKPLRNIMKQQFQKTIGLQTAYMSSKGGSAGYGVCLADAPVNDILFYAPLIFDHFFSLRPYHIMSTKSVEKSLCTISITEKVMDMADDVDAQSDISGFIDVIEDLVRDEYRGVWWLDICTEMEKRD